MCSEGLLGSLGGFYFQTVYFPLEETDKIEASWRRIFNRKFGRDPSSARIELYEQAQAGPDGKKGVARVHLAAQAMASLVTAVSRAMADVPPTSQRSTARSMVALSMERLGCSQDPNWWDCSHVTAALEEKLRLAKSKHLGDAFIYCLNRIEGVALDEVSTRASEVEVESARRSAFGRWTFGEPLTRGGSFIWRSSTLRRFQFAVAFRAGYERRPGAGGGADTAGGGRPGIGTYVQAAADIHEAAGGVDGGE